MTLLELKQQIDELIAKGYGYEGLQVYVAKEAKNPPMNFIFIPVKDISVGDPGGWGNTLVSIGIEEVQKETK